MSVFPFPGSARADAPADFEAGQKAYRGGDVVGAMVPLKRAAQAGHAAAQALYAQILDRSELNEEAVEWFRKSAQQNDADGQFGYGSMLAAGEGVKRDVAEGRKWIERAADQGHANAVNLIAQSLIDGQLGYTAEDRANAQAGDRLKRAADNQYLPAIDALAKAYASGGYGVTADAAQAERYAQRARALRSAKNTKADKK